MLDHWEEFQSVFEQRYQQQYGEWRACVGETFRRFLECGILANGFLRVRCTRKECGEQILVPWSCKRLTLCPSCGQRRSCEFGEYLHHQVLEEVPYRHVVFTIPKVLRPTFLRDRSLLRELSLCAWKSVRSALRTALRPLLTTTVSAQLSPGAVAAVATAGDLANSHPHIHMMVSGGAWESAGNTFHAWPAELNAERLTELFRCIVLRMLVRRRRLAESTADKMLSWRHAGFDVWIGEPIHPWEVESRKRLGRYLVKAPLSLERLRYHQTTCQVEYVSHKRGESRTWSALDFLAELSVHIPNPGQHLALYYGRHSKRTRGQLRAAAATRSLPVEPAEESEDAAGGARKRAFRLYWSQLLRMVWNVDVTKCARCSAPMQVVAAITDSKVAERILRHLGLFDKPRAPNQHECPPSPSPDGQQTLWAAHASAQVDSCQVDPCPPEAADPHLDDDWPVDPPFEED